MSLGWTSPLRHDRNSDTTTPTVPIAPRAMPGPRRGTHEDRSTWRSRRVGAAGWIGWLETVIFHHPLTYPRDEGARRSAGRNGSDPDRDLREPADRAGVEPHDAVVVDLPLGVPLQRLLERDAALHAGQRRAEAEVDPVPERH